MKLSRLLLAGAAAAAVLPVLRFNASASMPRGLYYRSYGGSVSAGELIAFCPSSSVLALLDDKHLRLPGSCPGNSLPLFKLVAARGGDRVCLKPPVLSINGRNSALPLLPRFEADRSCRTLAADELYVLGVSADSVDSRYFGPIRRGEVLYSLHPLWVEPLDLPAAVAGPVEASEVIRI